MKQSRNQKENYELEQQFALFKKGSQLLGFQLTERQYKQFYLYIKMLLERNQKVNLFSKHDEHRLAERHLLESISWTKNYPGISFPVMDLGSGAGFPGIPLSILLPDKSIYLVESKKKKALFLKEVASQLKLSVQIIPERVEELKVNRIIKNNVFCIISRAVANLSTLLKWSYPLLHPTGCLLAFKGETIAYEIKQLEQIRSKSLNFDVNVVDYIVVRNLATHPIEERRKLVKVALNKEHN